ncbi:MGH1-like glycoside hydrolase domain-containing protein [Granulosicoccus sp. 3-233]|uniref:MGH1-like glycoside hydrolase domain-containing protein n=1 Tax=Granulosicoccus sp. 3-233 TaxID=3417969 RepID=UPI003D32AFFE
MTRAESDWGTWTADRPLELSHLSSGFAMTPVLYSARANSATAIPPGELVRFGRRGITNGQVCFETRHEETDLRWRYDLAESASTHIHWHCDAHGEWGLRYWVNLCFSAPAGIGFRFDRATGVLRSDNETGPQLSVRTAKLPLMATFHDDLAALLDEYGDKGYFYLGSRGTSGAFAVLRFNLEEAPAMSCHISLSMAESTIAGSGQPNDQSVLPNTVAPLASEVAALSENRQGSSGGTSARSDESGPSTEHDTSAAQHALEAMHDVLAWNHVHDPINARSYTVLTRFWNQQKFGGFGIWMNDVMYHALMWSRFDAAKARSNIDAVFAWQTDEGNFPCLVTGNDAWLDRSQPPIVSYVIWCCHRNSQDKELLQWAFPRLLANHDWWWRRRSLHDTGLVAYGTSLDVGDGLYKGTKLAAKDESSMDNMAVHDPAEFDASTGLIQAADVGLNSLLALDGEILAQMARLLELDDEALRLEQQGEAHRKRIAEWLWDDSRGVFANRMMDGRFVQALAPTSFFPMAAGIATEAQVDSLIRNYLKPEEKFGGQFVLPSATRDDPAYQDNVYWRGRIWAPLNYWVYEGLRRYGREIEASTLASKSLNLFKQGWEQRQCGENYHAETGAIADQSDTDTFYTWGAMLPALHVKEVFDDTPWQGMSLSPFQAEGEFGPITTAWGVLSIVNEGSHWTIRAKDAELMSGTVCSRLSHVLLTESSFHAELDASGIDETLRFTGRTIIAARLGQSDLMVNSDTVTLSAGHDGGQLVLRFDTGR